VLSPDIFGVAFEAEAPVAWFWATVPDVEFCVPGVPMAMLGGAVVVVPAKVFDGLVVALADGVAGDAVDVPGFDVPYAVFDPVADAAFDVPAPDAP